MKYRCIACSCVELHANILHIYYIVELQVLYMCTRHMYSTHVIHLFGVLLIPAEGSVWISPNCPPGMLIAHPEHSLLQYLQMTGCSDLVCRMIKLLELLLLHTLGMLSCHTKVSVASLGTVSPRVTMEIANTQFSKKCHTHSPVE